MVAVVGLVGLVDCMDLLHLITNLCKLCGQGLEVLPQLSKEVVVPFKQRSLADDGLMDWVHVLCVHVGQIVLLQGKTGRPKHRTLTQQVK